MAKKKSGAGKRGKHKHKPRMLIVEARFYEHIADALLAGATDPGAADMEDSAEG